MIEIETTIEILIAIVSLYIIPILSIERKLTKLITIIEMCPNCPKRQE